MKSTGFGRLERNPGARPMSEINMTPLIDVMLVLLVIFIIAAPFVTSKLRLDLPHGPAAATSPTPASLSVALDAEGRVYLDDQPSSREAIVTRARQAAQRNPGTELLLRADRRVPYGQVAELIAAVQGAGLTRIGFITEPQPAPAKP